MNAVSINIKLSAQNYEELQELAGKKKMDLTDFIGNAIRVYTYLLKQEQQGKSLYVGKNDKAEKEIILPEPDKEG